MTEISRNAADGLVTVDRLIDHVTTVPAVAGQTLQLFVREKAQPAIADLPAGTAPASGVVLMVHGGYWPSTMAFDLPYQDYSWMDALARAGFDVFCMDMTGYGYSSRPLMDDPRNLSVDDQESLGPHTVPNVSPPPHPFNLVTSDSETDDIDAVVDFIRGLRGVDRVSLIGWSGGGIRTGTYTVRHPDKVERLVIFASSNFDPHAPSDPPKDLPGPGVPVTIQSRMVGEDVRWMPNVHCDGQVAPGMMDIVWPASMKTDAVGAKWGTGVLRAPGRTYWGWNKANAATIQVPTLVMCGEYDRLYESNIALYGALGTRNKAFLGIECASHFMAWEMQRFVLHRASAEWLASGTLEGSGKGSFWADRTGTIARMTV